MSLGAGGEGLTGRAVEPRGRVTTDYLSDLGERLRGMTMTAADRAARAHLRRQANLITRSQALAAGLTASALRHRLRPGGPWTAVLPGLYVEGAGELTAAQREIAVVLYAGGGCVITGYAALRRQGVRVPDSEVVDVLIADSAKRRSVNFVQFHRTGTMPDEVRTIGGIRYALTARAVADAVWGRSDLRSVTALVADAVQRARARCRSLPRNCVSGRGRVRLRCGPP